MTSIALGIIRKGRVELAEPIDLPDGTAVVVTKKNPFPDDDGPMTPEEIAAVLEAMKKVEPFEMTAEEEANIGADRNSY